MELSQELVSLFAKQIVNKDRNTSRESTVYGTVKVDGNGNKYVMLDGSDQLTPIADDEQPSVDSTTTNANEGDRVSVLIKNHTATVTGNISSPAARTGDVENIENDVDEIKKFDIAIGDQVQANEAYFKKLIADEATLGKLVAASISVMELLAKSAEIDDLIAGKITVTDLIADKIDADVVIADSAIIESLKSGTIDVLSLLADKAVIEELIATKANLNTLIAKNIDANYANIDFANITEAAIKKIFSDTGLIKDLVVGDQTITGELVGVTIIGDLIKGGTVVADKLVVLGEDGLYYKLNTDGVTTEAEQTDYNSLNGSIITAKSVTAEKVSVDDLVAFGATIGGFNLTAHSLYSGVKKSVDNTTTGIYMDTDAQFAIGDASNYLRFYKDENDNYRLDISAASVMLSQSAKDIETAIGEVDDKLQETQDNLQQEIESQKSDYQAFMTKFSKYIRFMEDENGNPSDTAMTIGSGDSAITLEIDNEKGLIFKKNGTEFGSWDGVDFHTGNIVVDVNERAQFGNFAFVPRSDGSLSFLKVGG